MVLPMGHTKEETTNQGKTNLACIMMHSVCPGVPVTIASRSTSAPSQRTAAWPLARYGAAIYDEFQLPSSHDHFLAQAGLQSFATGSEGGPGQVLENHGAIKLKHPMAICAKIAAFPPDVINRSLCFFMDKLTAESRCTDEELTIIGTGVAANTIRMNALAWIREVNFVEKVKDMLPKSTDDCRFGAYYTVMVALCRAKGGTEQDVIDYLRTCKLKCEDQHRKASQSGLADEIGANGTLDVLRYLEECSEFTINEIIREQDIRKKIWRSTELVKTIIEDNGTRRFNDVLKEYHIKESAVVAKFAGMAAEGKLVIDGLRACKEIIFTTHRIVTC
jgi:hypothetical protein